MKTNPDRNTSGQPWMRRKDWASCRVLHNSSGMAIGLWIWTLCWWSFIFFIGWVNYDKILRALGESWWNGALIGIFVGSGLLGLFFAMRNTLHWWRYGTSVLHLDTLPAYLGETFQGVLEARLEPRPRHPLHVELVCEDVLWVTSGHGNTRSTRMEVKRLGASNTTIEPWLITGTRMDTRSKIEIDVPADLPQFARDERGDGVRWVLSVATTGDDASFCCSFEVPVYART